jgi:hypothetical protein
MEYATAAFFRLSKFIIHNDSWIPFQICYRVQSRDSLVGIETGYEMDGRCLVPSREERFFFTT